MTAVAGPQEGTLTHAYAALDSKSDLESVNINRRHLLDEDVSIEIAYCGICHTDIHIAKNEWNSAKYPVVPGHEITGFVKEIGSKVTKFKVGDKCGVGFYVDTCRECSQCKDKQLEQYCEKGIIITLNSEDHRNENGCITCGGYSENIVVNEKYVFTWPESLPMDTGAPLLCAGITVFSPLNHLIKNMPKDKLVRVGIIGLGGLGHVAVPLAKAMGAHVSVISRSASAGKMKLAIELGADQYMTLESIQNKKFIDPMDIIIDTISVDHDIDPFLKLLNLDGTLFTIGLPGDPMAFSVGPLAQNRRRIMGSVVGSLTETQEMLELCAKKGIVCMTETIKMNDINKAYDRMLKGDVKFRFVVDMKASTWS